MLRWLARGRIDRITDDNHVLARVLAEFQCPAPASGLAALRYWGQRQMPRNGWVAAADPVYLEPQLDKLRLHGLPGLPDAELGPLLAYLNDRLCRDVARKFVAVDGLGYLVDSDEFPTSDLPPSSLEHRVPTEFYPVGDSKAEHRRLLSEIEMALHDQRVNLDRQASGMPPVNSLWLWGGGHTPQPEKSELPALFSNDGLLAGFWYSTSNVPNAWPGDFAGCVAADGAVFVATPSCRGSEDGLMDALLGDLKANVDANVIPRVVVYFGDMLRIELRRSDRLRIWKTGHPLLQQGFGL